MEYGIFLNRGSFTNVFSLFSQVYFLFIVEIIFTSFSVTPKKFIHDSIFSLIKIIITNIILLITSAIVALWGNNHKNFEDYSYEIVQNLTITR